MTAATITDYRSRLPVGRDGFVQLLHAEWTKLRTVRGWLIGLFIAAALIVALGVFTATSVSSQACHIQSGQSAPVCTSPPPPLTGPGGEPVNDSFYFVHRPLAGDGGITVQVSSLTGVVASDSAPPDQPLAGARPGVQPWSKAGLLIKSNTTPGSSYAAIMLTGGHGVRFQYNYTHDTAGTPGAVSAASPRWLRLTRSGDLVTGYDSTDGTHFARVGSARLTGLPATLPAGLFTASPDHAQNSNPIGGGESGSSLPSRATARFDRLSLQGNWPAGAWTDTQVSDADLPGHVTQTGDTVTVSGSGDIAPAVIGSGGLAPVPDPDRTLIGTFAGLIALVVVAGLFVTSEYRRGLMRTTLAASPRRGRVLAAKAIVIGAATLVIGLVAATITVLLGRHLLRSNGHFVYPLSTLTGLRIILGTAVLLALTAVAALALGTILRRGAGAVTAVIVAIVLPYILAVASLLPVSAGQWLLRVTPAAAFAVQQTLIQYPQVASDYTPTNGYYPLSPWAGIAVLAGYTALAVGIAAVLLRRRDA
jgi:ABC-type transport system involved in multi-copper enzyme maturation permease subunit